jgi:hypothetical protein
MTKLTKSLQESERRKGKAHTTIITINEAIKPDCDDMAFRFTVVVNQITTKLILFDAFSK